jgi:carboxypeptidase Taq
MMFKILNEKMAEMADLGYAMAVLNWDQEVYMPEKGASHRARQIATLSGLHHEKMTSKEIGDLLNQLSDDNSLTELEKADVKWILKDYLNAKKFTKEFVTNKSKTISEAFFNWDKAKKASDFSIFQPHLEKVVAIVREEAEIYGYEGHPYNALIDLYEPDMTVKELDLLFADVKEQLKPLIDQIREKAEGDESFLLQQFPKNLQTDLGEKILEKFGFDFASGRQDLSSHPFCTSFSALDVRVTTRVDEKDLANSIWSTIHECGHALYEQGLPADRYGLPSGAAISFGIHESQSRFWENCIGRSASFIKGFGGLFRSYFPQQLSAISDEQFYKGINVVKPSYIRTESDELTYHFHIMIRYEIEKELVRGTLKVKEVRDYWNQKYKQYLNLDITDDAKGVLQDVHWSHGGIGYFPTYSLGSFYAAQWWHCIKAQNPSAEEEVKKMNTANILAWLRENIHQYGKLYTATELCKKISGEPLNFKYFMQYAKAKYKDIYGIK